MSEVTCFMVEPTLQVKRRLRRYASKDASCTDPMFNYHRVLSSILDVIEVPLPPDHHEPLPARVSHDDPRWPKICPVYGYIFLEEDNWQEWNDRLFRLTDGMEPERRFTLHSPVPGMMWDAAWLGDYSKGPDGMHLCVVLPDICVWQVDGPSYKDDTAGPGWTRTGTPPKVTVTPSILTPNYHGFLTDGVLRSC